MVNINASIVWIGKLNRNSKVNINYLSRLYLYFNNLITQIHILFL